MDASDKLQNNAPLEKVPQREVDVIFLFLRYLKTMNSPKSKRYKHSFLIASLIAKRIQG